MIPPTSPQNFRMRSACIYADPKMRELQHFHRSRQHESRLRENAELEKRSTTLRSEGCEVVDKRLRRLAKEQAPLPSPARAGELHRVLRADDAEGAPDTPLEDRQAMLRRMDRFHTRLEWRDRMDYSLKRLLVDMELGRDDRLTQYSAQARCEHLDKIYDWFTVHGKKEARKERRAPPYVRYSKDGPVMPGSLRVSFVRGPGGAPAGRHGEPSVAAGRTPALEHSATLPAILGMNSPNLRNATPLLRLDTA